MPEPEGLEDLLMENAHAAMRAGLLLVEEERELEGRPPLARLADKKPGAPSSLPELRAWWDRYRKTKKATPRVRKLARDLKARYLEALRKTWEKASVSFRDGEEFDQQQAIAAVTKAADVGASRGRMIVATETTRYYNTVRREAYDKVDGVTHYLFISVRDHRTTKWCKCRSGLVYAKDSEVFKRETPPCFTASTPVLTSLGWQSIGTVKEGQFVFTHTGQFRRVTRVHRQTKIDIELLQIGHALATTNHPYLTRGGEFVWANEFNPEEGLCAVQGDLRALRARGVDAVLEERPEVLQHGLSYAGACSLDEWTKTSQLEGWEEVREGRVLVCDSTRAPEGKQARTRPGAQTAHGEASWAPAQERRGRTPYRPVPHEQLYRESASDEQFRTRCAASAPRRHHARQIEVFNLEVEIDHTYVAGGFFVHNCHWNCRSEITPLVKYNPSHRKLIADETRRRENVRCEPLPKGWNK